MYWFIAAVAVLVVEMFVGTLYLLIISAALAGAGAASLLFDGSAVPILTAAAISAGCTALSNAAAHRLMRPAMIWTSVKL